MSEYWSMIALNSGISLSLPMDNVDSISLILSKNIFVGMCLLSRHSIDNSSREHSSSFIILISVSESVDI